MSNNIIEIPVPSQGQSQSIQIEKKIFQKMMFIMNALEDDWTVKKSQDSYIFKKKHENRQEIFQEKYLETFLASNFSNDLLQKLFKT
jgi:hypothetical protein